MFPTMGHGVGELSVKYSVDKLLASFARVTSIAQLSWSDPGLVKLPAWMG